MKVSPTPCRSCVVTAAKGLKLWLFSKVKGHWRGEIGRSALLLGPGALTAL